MNKVYKIISLFLLLFTSHLTLTMEHGNTDLIPYVGNEWQSEVNRFIEEFKEEAKAFQEKFTACLNNKDFYNAKIILRNFIYDLRSKINKTYQTIDQKALKAILEFIEDNEKILNHHYVIHDEFGVCLNLDSIISILCLEIIAFFFFPKLLDYTLPYRLFMYIAIFGLCIKNSHNRVLTQEEFSDEMDLESIKTLIETFKEDLEQRLLGFETVELS